MNDENERMMDDLKPEDELSLETGEAAAEAIAAKDAEIAELKDRVLRAAAEVENVRRRLEREKLDASAYAVTGFARDLLAVADNLRRALDAGGADTVASPLLTGIEMTEKELLKAFERHGIARIDSVGAPLDPNRHQAMLEVENAEVAPGTIVAELQAGYMIRDRLLRPAMVSVAK